MYIVGGIQMKIKTAVLSYDFVFRFTFSALLGTKINTV